MIVISLLFFLLGVGLLVAGLVVESVALELGAVVSALLSALALYLGVRHRRPEPEQHTELLEIWGPPFGAAVEQPATAASTAEPTQDSEQVADADAGASDALTPELQPGASDAGQPDADPPDADPPDAGRVPVDADTDEVLVTDGRPRYHRRGCSSVLGSDSVPLRASEAGELGFTPCLRCRPDLHPNSRPQQPQRS